MTCSFRFLLENRIRFSHQGHFRNPSHKIPMPLKQSSLPSEEFTTCSYSNNICQNYSQLSLWQLQKSVKAQNITNHICANSAPNTRCATCFDKKDFILFDRNFCFCLALVNSAALQDLCDCLELWRRQAGLLRLPERPLVWDTLAHQTPCTLELKHAPSHKCTNTHTLRVITYHVSMQTPASQPAAVGP